MLFMAMTVDDQWPSLAPIRTSGAGSAYTHESHAICRSQNVEEGGREAASASDVTHFDTSSESDHLNRQSSSSKFPCVHFFTNCFSCTKQKSPAEHCRRRWCTPTAQTMRRGSPSLRSMAFSFPAGGIQSFHLSPTTKAQLSGAFPRMLSGKAQHYCMSPRTPAAGASLNRQLSGEIQHFSSPRMPGSREIHQYLSTPQTPSSGKVQHFSGAIPSPRTPFGSGATSPSSARQKKPSFTLIMPPDNKKVAGADQLDEPTSPHVTCIGRVRRQTHCKKLLHIDMITHCHDTAAKKKAITSKKPDSISDSSTCRTSNEIAKNSAELTSIPACAQRFGRRKLQNLHKIHGFQAKAHHVNIPFEADEGSLGENQGDDCTSPIVSRVAYCGEDLVYEDSQKHGQHISVNDAECISEQMRSLHKADHDVRANIRPNSSTAAESMATGLKNSDGVADSPDTPVPHTTCNHEIPEYEAHQA